MTPFEWDWEYHLYGMQIKFEWNQLGLHINWSYTLYRYVKQTKDKWLCVHRLPGRLLWQGDHVRRNVVPIRLRHHLVLCETQGGTCTDTDLVFQKNTHKIIFFSKCLLRLGVLCVFVLFCVLVFIGPFCHGALKLHMSSIVYIVYNILFLNISSIYIGILIEHL